MSTPNKYYLEYDEAFELKKLGFDEPCDEYFTSTYVTIRDIRTNFNKIDGIVSRPQYQQAFNFFREKFNLEGVVISWTEGGKTVWYFSTEPVGKPNIYRGYICTADKHEIAQYECLKDLINKAKNIL
jgi:hypothetical protein